MKDKELVLTFCVIMLAVALAIGYPKLSAAKNIRSEAASGLQVRPNAVEPTFIDAKITKYKPGPMEKSFLIAENFVKNSPTYKFDGSGLKLISSTKGRCEKCWTFEFSFVSSQGGYGNRTGKMLIQVITPHKIVVTVENEKVVRAITDQRYDEINKRFIK